MKHLIFILVTLVLTNITYAKTRKEILTEAKILDQICEQSCVLYIEEQSTGHIYGLIIDETFADVAELQTAIQTQATVLLPLSSIKTIDESNGLFPQSPAESIYDFTGKSLRKILRK